MKIIIPAREGSKGYPHKNRTLFKYIETQIRNWANDTIISTDDSFIIELAQNFNTNLKIHHRKKELAQDDTSVKDVILSVIEDFNIKDEILIILYLTYPERTLKNITTALKFFIKHDAKSLLCKKPIITHPYMCLKKTDELHGKQVTEHNLYRRQDYPECFEICHFISIMHSKEVPNLNLNLYNDDTIYFPLDKVVDVDLPSDMEKLNEKDNS
jgi:CMP-N-acetylneuraminic acid synthetase